MRFPNQRLAQLFDALKNETLPQDELARRFAVSTRTVRTDITALNALLEQHGAQFVLNRGPVISLKLPTRSVLLFSSSKRVPLSGCRVPLRSGSVICWCAS